MTADRVVGLVFALLGLAVLVGSGDLPIGSLAFPGAGMMPKLVAAIMLVLGLGVALAGGGSPRIETLDWQELKPAALILGIVALAVALYATLGFVLAMLGMLTALLVVVERQSGLRAILYGTVVTGLAWCLFRLVLKVPLERGLLGV
jgi:fumarate reductase subunit C